VADGPNNNSQQPRHSPRTQAINFAIDLLSLLALLAIAATGLVLKYVLPPGIRGGRGLRLWDLSRHEWGEIHFWLSVALAGLVLVHIVLHWAWVCAVVARWFRSKAAGARQLSPGRRAAYGGALLLAVAGLLFGSVWLAGANATRSGEGFRANGGRGYRGGRTAAVFGGVQERTAQAPTYDDGGCLFP
jgi:hypothetical protein